MGCAHGMDPAWCYICRVEKGGRHGRAAWGLDIHIEDERGWEEKDAPMTQEQTDYLRFLCEEFGLALEAGLTEGEADLLIQSFLDEPMTDSQRRTLDRLGAVYADRSQGVTYGWARGRIRSLYAARLTNPRATARPSA
jgi:hypothetical protein